MGLYTDLASGVQTGPKPNVGLDRSSAQQLLSKAHLHDSGVRPAFAEADAVTRIGAHTFADPDGTYTLTVSIPTLGVLFTTAALAHDANAAAIEAAIDTASPASVPNGDLAVTEGGSAGLEDGFIDITAEDAVAGMPVYITIDGGGDVFPGAVTLTSAGQADRKGAQALYDLNVIAGTLWASGLSVSGLTKPDTNGQTRARRHLALGLAKIAAVEDGSDAIYDAVVALYPLY